MNFKRSLSVGSKNAGVVIMTVALVAACGGGGGETTNATTGPSVASGMASKGPLTGSTVCAFAITGGAIKGAQIGTCATTDGTGNYSINLGTYAGPVLFQAAGGSYVDEATGKTVTLMTPLHSLLFNATGGPVSVAITALTELAYQNANALAGGLTNANVQDAIASVQNNFGIPDIVGTMPVDALNVPSSATVAQKNYALTLATISQYLNNQPGTSLASGLQTMQTCLASPATGCGSGSTSVGTLLNTAMTTFVSNHKTFAGLAGSTGRVVFFGSVAALPTNGTDGATGATGATGAAGATGVAGVNGAVGATGATGAVGSGVTWINVTGMAQQAASNTGYMANSASLVTITLPASPVLGDVVQVNGVGTGGWTIVQNSGQSIVTKNLIKWGTTSTAGPIAGLQYDAIELQYVGDNKFSVLNYVGVVSQLPVAVLQGGLTWVPVTSTAYTYDQAVNFCNSVSYGNVMFQQARIPTLAELTSLYLSGAMYGKGWTYAATWSSTRYSGDSTMLHVIDLSNSDVTVGNNGNGLLYSQGAATNVACVYGGNNR